MAVAHTLPRELRELAQSLPLLPGAWRRPGGLPDAQTLHGFLVEWVERALALLDELEGYLIAARDEPAYRALDAAAALQDVAAARRWLQQCQAEPRPSEPDRRQQPVNHGDLDRMLRVLRARPDQLSAFDVLKATHAFLTSPDRFRIVLAYRYLTDARLRFPEGPALADLRELQATLLDMLSRRSTLVDIEARRRFLDGFAAFQFRYRAAYQREHQRRRHPEIVAPYLRLRQEPAYRLLERLRGIEGVPVRARWEALEDQLKRLVARQCSGVDEAVLEVSPVCTCGFRLDEAAPPSVEELREEIVQAVRHGLRALRDPEVRARLVSHCHRLAARGDAAQADRLRRVVDAFQSRPEHLDIHQWADLLDEQALALIREALAYAVQVVPRPLDTLVEELAGRELTWEQVQEIVARWAFAGHGPRPGYLIRPLPPARDELGQRSGQGAEGGRRRRNAEARESASWPQSAGAWERFYCDMVRAAGPSGRTGGDDAPWAEAFRRFYRSQRVGGGGQPASIALDLFEAGVESGLLAGARKPLTLPLLVSRGASWRGSRPEARGLIWVDALRLDVWHFFLERFGRRVDVREEGLLWSWPPATTAGQLARLDAEGITVTLVDAEGAAELPAAGASGACPVVYVGALEEILNEGQAARWDDGADKGLVERLAAALAQRVLPLLQERPAWEWVIFGDHGFAAGSGGGHRFRQGGETLEEVLVPWARIGWMDP